MTSQALSLMNKCFDNAQRHWRSRKQGRDWSGKHFICQSVFCVKFTALHYSMHPIRSCFDCSQSGACILSSACRRRRRRGAIFANSAASEMENLCAPRGRRLADRAYKIRRRKEIHYPFRQLTRFHTLVCRLSLLEKWVSSAPTILVMHSHRWGVSLQFFFSK